MIAEPPIPDLGRVTASVITKVLATQFKLSAITGPPEQCLVGSVTLTGGRVSGDVNLQLPEAFTAKLAALLLGRSVTSVTHESAADVTGELCNMLAGRVAATLAAAGYSSIFEHPDGTGDLFGRQNLPERLDLRGTFAQSRVAVNFKSR